MCSGLKSIADFRAAVAAESAQLMGLCSRWSKELDADALRETHILSEDVLGDINVAIGQAELLKKERFKQFSGLIDDCEFKRGEKETTVQDLQGFWDIIYFQIEDILKKFAALDKLQSNNWQKSTPSTSTKPTLAKNNAARPRPAVTKSRVASSGLRAHIMAARNKMNQLSISSSSPSKDVPSLVVHSSSEQECNEKENIPVIVNNEKLVDAHNHKSSRLEAENSSEDLGKSAKGVLQISTSNNTVRSSACTPLKKLDDDKQQVESSKKQSPELSPPVTTFDAGFFQVKTPSKSKVTQQKQNNPDFTTPSRSLFSQGPDTKVLSSSLLKQRVRCTPVTHKDYSPCMRITRSMKKMRPAASED